MSDDFFISYNSADSVWAQWIAWELQVAQYEVILKAWDLQAGYSFPVEMQRASEKADRTIALPSPNYLKPDFIGSEFAAMLAERPTTHWKLIPIRIASCEPPGIFKTTEYIDLVGLDVSAARTTFLSGVHRGSTRLHAPLRFPGPTRDRLKSAFPVPALLHQISERAGGK